MTPYLHGAAYTMVALILLTMVGNSACRLLFQIVGLSNKQSVETTTVPPAGWIIGWLERLVLAIGIVFQSWEVFAAVIALKTVARFKELDDQNFAEYFLVGSLFSILWASIITLGWLAYDHSFGSNIHGELIRITNPDSENALECGQNITRLTSAQELCNAKE